MPEEITTINPLTGEPIKAELSIFADAVIKARNEKGPWEVMDLIIKHWTESNPVKYNSFVTNVEITKSSQLNKFGSNKNKTVRFTLDIPEQILTRFRTIYKSNEFPFDTDFYKKFWDRYPVFRVSERK